MTPGYSLQAYDVHVVRRILCLVAGLPVHLAVRIGLVQWFHFGFSHFFAVSTERVHAQLKAPQKKCVFGVQRECLCATP